MTRQRQDAVRMAVWEEEDPAGDAPSEPASAQQSHARPGQGATKDGAAGEQN